MTAVGEAFKKALGAPNPISISALKFKSPALEYTWAELYKEIGAGWFLDRYVYLFGPNIKKLHKALKAWNFLMPDDTKYRMPIGYTAFGSILVQESTPQKDKTILSRVGILDPFLIRYFRDPNLDFIGMLGYWFPHRELPFVFDGKIEKFYKSNFIEEKDMRSDFEIYGMLKSTALGGTLDPSNFKKIDITKYFEFVTAPPYKKAYLRFLKKFGLKKGQYEISKK